MAQACKRRSGSRTRKEQRLEARITPDQKRLIERAAELRGTTVTEFVVAGAQQAAADTIKDFEVLTFRPQARKVFVNAILKPPPKRGSACRRTALPSTNGRADCQGTRSLILELSRSEQSMTERLSLVPTNNSIRICRSKLGKI